jgi:ATP synthase protein I
VFTAVLIQASVTLLAAVVAWWGWGLHTGLSLAAGGASIVVPNALLALRLRLAKPEHAPVVLLVGEFVKIGLSVLLLWAVYRWFEGLSWGGLIIGLILALQALLLTPWVTEALDRQRA